MAKHVNIGVRLRIIVPLATTSVAELAAFACRGVDCWHELADRDCSRAIRVRRRAAAILRRRTHHAIFERAWGCRNPLP
jgi:hypothetical protein